MKSGELKTVARMRRKTATLRHWRSRRRLPSRSCYPLIAALLFACAPRPEAVDEAPKPNVILILADDLGHGDTGYTGVSDIATPNIDRLAAEGVQIARAYANGPVCTPTRAALLSGWYQQRTGADRVIYVREREVGMDPSIELLPKFLKEAGYATGVFGKWHLGFPKEGYPSRKGFDEFVGFVSGNIDYFAHTDRLENHDLWRGEEEIFSDRYFTDLIGDEAVDFIRRHAREPFFLYLPFNAPHDPFQGPEHRDTAGDQRVTRVVNRKRTVLKSMVESMDANIGRILDSLDAEGLAEETAVFFMSDNGGVPVVSTNTPFRGYKTTLWEGGIRSPFYARWTGRFPAGRKIEDTPAISMDLFATTLAIAGVSLPADRIPDGVNLLPLLDGSGGIDRDTLYFRYRNPRGVLQKAMTQGGWKYLSDEKGEEHLFHLAEDVGEEHDLKEAEPERFERMKKTWSDWETRVLAGAPALPEYRP